MAMATRITSSLCVRISPVSAVPSTWPSLAQRRYLTHTTTLTARSHSSGHAWCSAHSSMNCSLLFYSTIPYNPTVYFSALCSYLWLNSVLCYCLLMSTTLLCSPVLFYNSSYNMPRGIQISGRSYCTPPSSITSSFLLQFPPAFVTRFDSTFVVVGEQRL